MRESQEVEHLGLPFPSLFPISFGELPELDQARLVWVQFQPELPQSLPKFCEETICIRPVLKSEYIVIRVSDNDDIASRALPAPDVHPQVEHVMQIDVREQRRSHRTLRGTYLCVLPFTFLHYSGLQPFLDQPNDTRVGDAVLNELYKPFVRQIVEKSTNVAVQHPVHFLPCDCDVQRIQRLMLVSSWPKTIRKAPKILLIYLIEDCNHGLLNNLVLQCRDPQWPLPTIRFRNIDSSRRLRLISATVNTAIDR